MRYCILISLALFFCLHANAQQVIVHGGFFSDSVDVGLPTKYFLAVKYPSSLNIHFPDSASDFQPFEYASRKYFPTSTKDSVSYDSVIYALRTFEVDRKQPLALSVYRINGRDTSYFAAQTDTILISQLVAEIPDSIPTNRLPLKMNTAYQKVPSLFNYPVLIIVVGSICLLALIVFVFFGEKIKRHFRLARLQKNHKRFISAYSEKLNQVKTNSSKALTESTLFTWKKYLELLEGQPYTKLTTRETVIMEKDETLGTVLHTIDKAIYGHEAPVLQPLIGLQEYAERKFNRKLEEVKHGK